MPILQNQQKIIDWLNRYNIKNYTIRKEFSSQENKETFVVDVHGDVMLDNKALKSMDVQFGVIEGYFDCSSNELTSLKGCPREISDSFSCASNKLSSLKYGPQKVGQYYYCNSNKLTSLKYMPESFIIYFDCSGNQLKSLNGISEKIASLDCSSNQLTSFRYADEISIKELMCYDNPIQTLLYFFKSIDLNQKINISKIPYLENLTIGGDVVLVDILWKMHKEDVMNNLKNKIKRQATTVSSMSKKPKI